MLTGKVPNDILARLLGKVKIADPRVIVGPRVGEDATVIDFGDRLLVAKTDPITFAAEAIGWYAVNVNANDIATMGATPRWFLASVLLAEGSSEKDVEDIFDQILSACQAIGVSLVGGHTEVSYGLDRPIVVGCMLGEVEKGALITTAGAKEGDDIVLTKGIAIEGASLLAREAGGKLRNLGVAPEVLRRAEGLLFSPGISVVKDAHIAAQSAAIHSMHDPTEGGLATGLWEVAAAAGVGLEVEAQAIPVLDDCRIICQAASLDPLGLLASGALLITVPAAQTASLVDALGREGIPAYRIGRILDKSAGIKMRTAAGLIDLPTFARDEVARMLT